jgi:hypothetical protein
MASSPSSRTDGFTPVGGKQSSFITQNPRPDRTRELQRFACPHDLHHQVGANIAGSNYGNRDFGSNPKLLSTKQRADGTESLDLGFEAVAWRNGDHRTADQALK